MIKIHYQHILISIISILLLDVCEARAYSISDAANLPIRCIKKPKAVGKKYDRAVEQKPNFAKLYNDRGEAKMQIGDCNGASEDFDRALELDSQYAQTYINQGLLHLALYRDSNNTDQFLEELWDSNIPLEKFLRALSIDPSYITDYNRLVSSYPTSKGAYVFRGIGRYIIKDLNGSLRDFNLAIKIDPKIDLFYRYRSLIKYALGDKLGAKKDKNSADKLFSYYFKVRGRAAADYTIRNILSVPIHLDPNNAKAYWTRADAIFNFFGYGLEDYLRVIEIQPNNPYAHYQVSELWQARARDEPEEKKRVEMIIKANEYLKKAKMLIINNAEVMSLNDFGSPNHRAEIRNALGDIKGANADWQKIRTASSKKQRL